ncbi:MAG: hypothetical protein NXH96_06870 [Alteromonadaceae bacterium]|nr:hypothetical protein [Alteromonadaceae bacterium]
MDKKDIRIAIAVQLMETNMPSRQFLAALLSILLLIGGPTQTLAGVANTDAANTSISAVDWDGMTQASAFGINHSKMAVDCDTSEQQNCHRAASHCASASVYGMATATSVPSIQTAAHVDAIPFWAVYRSPISDVLTPPPDTLS